MKKTTLLLILILFLNVGIANAIEDRKVISDSETQEELIKSFNEVIKDADIEMAKQKGMTYQEFLDYCISKYNANWDDENLLMTEVVSPEDIEAVNIDDYDKSTSWYRNANTTDDSYFEKE